MGARHSFAVGMPQDYSSAVQPDVTADAWQDSLMLYQRKQAPNRIEAAQRDALSTNSRNKAAQIEVATAHYNSLKQQAGRSSPEGAGAEGVLAYEVGGGGCQLLQ